MGRLELSLVIPIGTRLEPQTGVQKRRKPARARAQAGKHRASANSGETGAGHLIAGAGPGAAKLRRQLTDVKLGPSIRARAGHEADQGIS